MGDERGGALYCSPLEVWSSERQMYRGRSHATSRYARCGYVGLSQTWRHLIAVDATVVRALPKVAVRIPPPLLKK